MTKTELIEKLNKCNELDTETAHSQADDLLLEYIGDNEISHAYNQIDKWYA